VTAGCTHVLELPGVQTQGESVSDVRRMVGEAITFVLEERRISGELSRPGAESAGPEKACPELGNSEPFQPALTTSRGKSRDGLRACFRPVFDKIPACEWV
jgi:predicted RNase H-like HicB family nuclease